MRGAWTTGVVLSAALAGCSGAPPAAGLSATVEQSRDAENRHQVQLVVRDGGPADLHVVRVQLRSPGFADVAPVPFDDVVGAGSQTAFPVGIGAVDCRSSTRGSTVVVGVRGRGGVREQHLTVPDGDPVLPRLHARTCALERLARAVDVRFGPQWSRSDTGLSGTVELRRRAGEERVTLSELGSNVIFTLRADRPLPLALGTDDTAVEVPVTLTADRCDPHALIESKRTYVFPAYVALRDEPPLQVLLTPDDAGVAALAPLLRECAAR